MSLLEDTTEKRDQMKLPASITLSRGARVILTHNVAVPLGLVNSATGTIYDFIFDSRAGPIIANPTAEQRNSNSVQLPIVLVQFDEQFYNGESFIDGVPRVVPICTEESRFRHSRYVLRESCYGT